MNLQTRRISAKGSHCKRPQFAGLQARRPSPGLGHAAIAGASHCPPRPRIPIRQPPAIAAPPATRILLNHNAPGPRDLVDVLGVSQPAPGLTRPASWRAPPYAPWRRSLKIESRCGAPPRPPAAPASQPDHRTGSGPGRRPQPRPRRQLEAGTNSPRSTPNPFNHEPTISTDRHPNPARAAQPRRPHRRGPRPGQRVRLGRKSDQPIHRTERRHRERSETTCHPTGPSGQVILTPCGRPAAASRSSDTVSYVRSAVAVNRSPQPLFRKVPR